MFVISNNRSALLKISLLICLLSDVHSFTFSQLNFTHT